MPLRFASTFGFMGQARSTLRRGLAENAGVLEECASSSAVIPNTMQSHASCSGDSGAEAASSAFSWTRIQGLSELRSKFDNDLEFDVESSKSHWTEVSAATANSDDRDEQVPNSVVFEKIKEHPEWGPFFRRQPYELEIGGKIAEGGQAEIFEAFGTNKYDVRCVNNEKTSLVLKVFKEGFSLVDLQRLWPPGIASAAIPHRYFARQVISPKDNLCWALGVQLLDDGRFAFIFDRHWGDLRKLIDEKMLKSNGCPPFSAFTTYMFILSVATGMCNLHKVGILHNDLKAANVLVVHSRRYLVVADFESSVGIVGTGFWRAPEVLLALKNENLKQETFTQQTDVDSFAMTCYEVITGRMPFEGHDVGDYDIVLRGERPTLPDDPYSLINNLVTKCWHQDPSQRPSFAEIVIIVEAIKMSSRFKFDSKRKE